MTHTNHRLHTLHPARRTAKAYAMNELDREIDLSELAFFDAKTHMATSRNVSFGKRCADPQNVACAAHCGHPACNHGCTLVGRNGW